MSNSLFPDQFDEQSDKFRKKHADVLPCEYQRIRHIFKDFHYKGARIGGGITQCFGMLYAGRVVGGAVIGPPRHTEKYPGAIDIRRMACIDDSPKNSESYFLGQVIKWISKNTDANYVLSYSDLTEGHNGTIYKAANFRLVGQTSPTKSIIWNGETYHMRSLTIERDYSYALREALDSGGAYIKTGLPKNIWIYDIKKRNNS